MNEKRKCTETGRGGGLTLEDLSSLVNRLESCRTTRVTPWTCPTHESASTTYLFTLLASERWRGGRLVDSDTSTSYVYFPHSVWTPSSCRPHWRRTEKGPWSTTISSHPWRLCPPTGGGPPVGIVTSGSGLAELNSVCEADRLEFRHQKTPRGPPFPRPGVRGFPSHSLEPSEGTGEKRR